jgi:hypothetical protein
MPSSIWTRCAGASELRPLAVDAWRVVEAQHLVSTRKLVGSDAEQQLLEELIDGAKPPAPGRPGLHYLLSTPFRYPPLRNGSRFGSRHERGMWYGAEQLHTAFAEVAYYRILFLEGTTAPLEPLVTPLTAFRVLLRTDRGIDLSRPPFAAHAAAISDPTSYDASQPLGTAMRTAGVHAFRFHSARDPGGVIRTGLERPGIGSPTDGGTSADPGSNIAAFDPGVFGRRQPRDLQTWHCTATRSWVEVSRRDYFERASLRFERAQFMVGGVLPAPALGA